MEPGAPPPLIGGRLLGQGVYGCTFSPAPRCAGGKVFREVGGLPAVGKVTVEDSADELAVGRAIMRLPMASHYFALPTESCVPALPVEDADRDDCKVFTDSAPGAKWTLLPMRAAGQELVSWARDLNVLAANYLRLFKHLLEGMIVFQTAGFVHNDIHMGNILVDGRGVARYIDFGLSYNVGDVKAWADANLGVTFKPKYIWDAPELHCWRAMKAGIRVPDALRRIKELSGDYAALERQFPQRPAEAALTGFMATAGADGGAFVRTWGKGTDCWRLGLLFWFLWNDLVGARGFERTPLWSERAKVRQILGGLTEFDPRRRWNARRALTALDERSRMTDGPTVVTA